MGIKRCKLAVTEEVRDEQCSWGNMVNGIVITSQGYGMMIRVTGGLVEAVGTPETRTLSILCR